MRRVLIAAGLLLALLLVDAGDASAFSSIRPTVSPSVTVKRRPVTVSFVIADTVGEPVEGTSYLVEVKRSRRNNRCDDDEFALVTGFIPAGSLVSVRLRPDPTGWCRGSFAGTVTVVDDGCRPPDVNNSPNCGNGRQTVIGRFSMRRR